MQRELTAYRECLVTADTEPTTEIRHGNIPPKGASTLRGSPFLPLGRRRCGARAVPAGGLASGRRSASNCMDLGYFQR